MATPVIGLKAAGLPRNANAGGSSENSEDSGAGEDFASPPWLAAFRPRRWMSNGHVQTLAGNYLPRRNGLPAAQAYVVEVAPAIEASQAMPYQAASHVLCHCHWQPEGVRRERLTVLLLHGLEGSSNSQYVIGNTNKLWAAGFNVIRMNMRNCGASDLAPNLAPNLAPDLDRDLGIFARDSTGGSSGAADEKGDGRAQAGEGSGKVSGMERLSPTLYHSGMSGDVLAVSRYFIGMMGLESVALVGYSMGGNLVLKLAGEVTAESFPELRAVVGVSPAMDLGPSADALHRLQNRLYEKKFLRAMKQRFRRKVELFPERYSLDRLRGVDTLRAFDDRVTAFYEGFAGADDYYYRAAAARVVDSIAVPTLVLHALDDPFVRILPVTCERMRANENIAYVETQHGGHCAFLATADPVQNGDGYWAEKTLLGFLLAHQMV